MKTINILRFEFLNEEAFREKQFLGNSKELFTFRTSIVYNGPHGNQICRRR